MGALLMLGCAEWIFCYAFELGSVKLQTKIFWNTFQYVGIVSVPTLWFLFTVKFTGREHWLRRRNLILFAIIPVVTLVLVFTNHYHRLMWTEVFMGTAYAITTIEKKFGPAFWCYVSYVYTLMLISTYLLLQMLIHSRHLYRWQASALLIGQTAPTIGRGLIVLGLNPFGYVDLEVLGLVVSSLMVAWCIFRLRLLDIVPVARESIIESMQDAVIVLDAENHIVDINPAAEHIIGYSASEAVGWPLDQIWSYWSEQLQTSRLSSSGRTVIDLKAGKESRTYDVSISPLTDWRGRLMSRVIALRDISERKRSEEALRESERRQAMILDAIPDMIYEMDLKGNILYANQFAREIIGIGAEEVKTLRLSDILDEDGLKTAAAVTKGVLANNTSLPPSIYYLRTHDGRRVPIEAQTRVVTNSIEKKTLLGVARDITERHRAEQLLRESEEKYRTLFEETKDALFIATVGGEMLDLNPAGVELFGYSSREELEGVNAGDLYVNPHDRERFQKRIADSGFVKDYEMILKRKDGRRINVLVTATVMVNERGEITAYRGIMRDITEKKQLEQQLFQAQKMESIGTLAGGIAHDFNNILGGILGYASFMKAKIDAGHPFQNYIDTIEKSAVRASELTAKLLAFARGGKYDVKPVDINRLVEETLQIMGSTLDKSIEIHVDPEPELATVEADAAQLQQILMNLCLNARDAMPAGGRLVIKTFPAVVDGKYFGRYFGAKAGRYVAVAVTDTGIGMAEETKQRIFEPFFTTKEKGKGTGLGLSMVYSVVKNHGGFVSVYSEPGIGSTFKVYLPESGKPELKIASTAAMPRGHNELILVVDDEAALRSLAHDTLEAYGYRVMSTENGLEAVEVYQKHKDEISVVILDMVMPKMGGHEAFLKLKEINPHVKALLSTGYSQTGKAQEILDSGVLGFIQKPYQLNELLLKLDSVLNASPVASTRG